VSERKSIVETFGGVRRIALLIVVFAVGTWFYHWQTAASGDAMAEVASQLGLQVYAEGQRRQMRGRIDDIGVAVDTTTERLAGDVRWYTDFKIYAPDQPHGRIVGASLRQQAIGGMEGTEWLSTGDEVFDDAVLVEGDPATFLAHLDAEARTAVIAATEAGWALEAFTWSARESGRVGSADKIRSLLEVGLAAARALRSSGDQDAALAERGQNDSSPGVRAAAAEARKNDASGWSGAVAEASAPVTRENALDALAEVYTPRSLEAALMLAQAGDDRQEVRGRLVAAISAKERVEEVIAALAKVGGPVEIAMLTVVTGEHEAAAKAAIAQIEGRL